MSAIEKAPGPSPWYLAGQGAGVPDYEWVDAGDSAAAAGATVLMRRKQALLVLDFYNYVSLLDADTMLVWHQQRDTTGPTAPVVLRVFHVSQLLPLDTDIDAVCDKMRHDQASCAAAVPPLNECAIPTRIANERRTLAFPEELRHLDELLLLCRSSAVEASPAWESNLALIVARPSDGSYQLYPQDWFNGGGFDYDYEWVTRVARDPRTGHVHGDGIRIAPFVLDSTLRSLETAR